MRITPAAVWTASLPLTFGIWLLVPQLRSIFSIVLAIHGVVLAIGIARIQTCFFGPVLLKNPAKPDAIALTFDDGPDPAITPKVLDLLKRHGIQATFFMIGIKAAAHPELVRRAYAEGHTIACHDLTHSPLSNFRMGTALEHDLSRALAIIKSSIGVTPLLYRPPVGLMNPHVLPVLSKLGLLCAGWSLSAADAGNRRMGALSRIGTIAQAGGNILLLHDVLPRGRNAQEVLEAFERMISDIRAKKLKPQTIDQLFGIPAYRV